MSLWMPKKKPLYAPMLSTFGGGSVRGFGGGGAAGGGGEETTYNPYAVTWSGTTGQNADRTGYPLYYFSPEAIVRGFSSTDAKYGEIWGTDNSYDRSVAFSPEFRVAATDSGTRFMDAPTITGSGQGQYPNFSSYANNTNLPYPSPSFNNGSSWMWDTGTTNYTGTFNGGSGVSYVEANYVTASNATSWTNVSQASYSLNNGFGEESSFRAGKYLFVFGYYQSFVYDLEDNDYPHSSNVHTSLPYSSSAPSGAAILCPQHNFLGLYDTYGANAYLWDYDDGTVSTVNMNWGTPNANTYGGGYYFLYPHDGSKVTSFNTSNYSRSDYDVIESEYNNCRYSAYNSGSSWSNAARFWRGMSYNPFTEKHYLFGTSTTVNEDCYAAEFNASSNNPNGTSAGRSVYVRNRGWAKPDPFSHKLADFGGITVDYDS